MKNKWRASVVRTVLNLQLLHKAAIPLLFSTSLTEVCIVDATENLMREWYLIWVLRIAQNLNRNKIVYWCYKHRIWGEKIDLQPQLFIWCLIWGKVRETLWPCIFIYKIEIIIDYFTDSHRVFFILLTLHLCHLNPMFLIKFAINVYIVKNLWWFILCANLTGPGCAQIKHYF